MERNTFSISAYIAAPPDLVYDFLCDLRTLDEWTLSCRMKQKIDDDTWLGGASGYQEDLYYHILRFGGAPFRGVQWHCGVKQGDYYQVYPTFLFPPDSIEPGSSEPGVYFHWISFINPVKATPMILQGLDVVHTSECRALKGTLERRVGLREPGVGAYDIRTATIYIDAPIEAGAELVGDLRTMSRWSHLLRPRGEVQREEGEFLDEYDQVVRAGSRAWARGQSVVVQHDYVYPDHDFMQRVPTVLIPCSVALGDPAARGFMLQRITFWKRGVPPRRGKLQIEDFQAEIINIKRILEMNAGNLDTFAKGTSYMP